MTEIFLSTAGSSELSHSQPRIAAAGIIGLRDRERQREEDGAVAGDREHRHQRRRRGVAGARAREEIGGAALGDAGGERERELQREARERR